MSAFVSYDPETGEIMEWGQTSQPGNLEIQGVGRGLVSILGAWSAETHYIDIATEQAVERPAMTGVIEKDEAGHVTVTGAPPGAVVEIALAAAGECNGAGAFTSPEPVETDHIVLKKWPYRDKMFEPE